MPNNDSNNISDNLVIHVNVCHYAFDVYSVILIIIRSDSIQTSEYTTTPTLTNFVDVVRAKSNPGTQLAHGG